MPPGPALRTDIVEVFILRAAPGDAFEFLLLRRAREPMLASWHPVLGHIEPGESSTQAARRELREETALDAPDLRALYALERVRPFFLPGPDQIVLSPRFAAVARPAWEPTLNSEHDAARWVPHHAARGHFLWPGQRDAIDEIQDSILDPASISRDRLRVL